ncbi:SDR family oxidoreductase [Stakelama sp. CBK3Z-3]|uniref:SDR family oxidoreductase n=1 Tax=Stakelama flava TaxID=2860338 RepID=A0ABS6XI48_9SPHN|nr:SDR family oxidoreductase [Stakelama flava]MBW4329873.1 SDR family oxidoreductase [Stakelama flava]
MRVFITGATGWVGSALTGQLVEAGHQVVGLVRSEEKARLLTSLGGEPLSGALNDLDTLKRGTKGADAVVHTAFGRGLGQPAAFAEAARQDRQAIEAFGEVFEGSNRLILVTGGIGVLPEGQVLTEETPPLPVNPAFPRDSEQTAAALAERGIRAATVRLPRSVHGAGESHGFLPQLMKLARQKGESGYIGDGKNVWPSVHRLDAARLYKCALEKNGGASTFNAVAEQGIAFRDIAEAIGRRLGLPTRSIAPDEAMEYFGPLAMPVRGNGPVSSNLTKRRLDWEPREPGLIEDIEDNY